MTWFREMLVSGPTMKMKVREICGIWYKEIPIPCPVVNLEFGDVSGDPWDFINSMIKYKLTMDDIISHDCKMINEYELMHHPLYDKLSDVPDGMKHWSGQITYKHKLLVTPDKVKPEIKA